MPTYVYVAAQDDNKISIFTMDGASGELTLQGEQAVSGGPSLLAISPGQVSAVRRTPGGGRYFQLLHRPGLRRVDPQPAR